MKTVAIIGTTASGKSDIAHQLAREYGAVLLSCDSLAVYKEVDIASAKPSQTERADLTYFGLDLIEPNLDFSVMDFINEYKNAQKYCIENSKNLIIVGGTSFYLKALINGLSNTPQIDLAISQQIQLDLINLPLAYQKIKDIDPDLKIDPNDRYRIEKALTIIYGSNCSPTEWYKENLAIPIVENLDILEVYWDRVTIIERIRSRTRKMIDSGIVDETAHLERKYKRGSQIFRSIGLKECLEYLDGKLTFDDLKDQITTHTAQFAKRQQTFNNNQFSNIFKASHQEVVAKAQLLLKQD